jgi:hypothetical protein
MWEELRLRVSENGVLRKKSGPKRDEVNYIMRSFMICTAHQMLFERSNREE